VFGWSFATAYRLLTFELFRRAAILSLVDIEDASSNDW